MLPLHVHFQQIAPPELSWAHWALVRPHIRVVQHVSVPLSLGGEAKVGRRTYGALVRSFLPGIVHPHVDINLFFLSEPLEADGALLRLGPGVNQHVLTECPGAVEHFVANLTRMVWQGCLEYLSSLGLWVSPQVFP